MILCPLMTIHAHATNDQNIAEIETERQS